MLENQKPQLAALASCVAAAASPPGPPSPYAQHAQSHPSVKLHLTKKSRTLEPHALSSKQEKLRDVKARERLRVELEASLISA
jgi:hypothetical protein